MARPAIEVVDERGLLGLLGLAARPDGFVWPDCGHAGGWCVADGRMWVLELWGAHVGDRGHVVRPAPHAALGLRPATMALGQRLLRAGVPFHRRSVAVPGVRLR